MYVILTFTSCDRFTTEESFVVTYYPGFQEFYSRVSPPIFEKVEPSETIFISKETYNKMKEYAYSSELHEHARHIDARLCMKIDTVNIYLGVYDYGYNPSYQIQEMEYLIKCNSYYYNYFTKEELKSNYCKEVSKFGIPKNYKYIDLSKQHKKLEYYSYLLLVE